MIKEWIDNLVFSASNDDIDARRAHPRRKSDSAVVMIDGKNFVVENWSEGGLLLSGDAKMFSVDQPIETHMKFKVNKDVLEFGQAGRVVRKGTNKFAIQFAELNGDAFTVFKRVIENAVTNEFAASQMA